MYKDGTIVTIMDYTQLVSISSLRARARYVRASAGSYLSPVSIKRAWLMETLAFKVATHRPATEDVGRELVSLKPVALFKIPYQGPFRPNIFCKPPAMA